jgi:hypothetical protein
MKICTTCKKTFDLSYFDIDVRYKSGHRSQCKRCNSLGKVESRLRRNLKSSYGITPEDYELILEKQNKVCKICGLPETRITRPNAKAFLDLPPRLAVDHDHKTGKIRGLLCHKCNVGLGNFNDNLELLKNAIKYLEENTDV